MHAPEPSRKEQVAFGHPGIEPRWTVSAKSGVGTAYSADSRVWYTISLGILSEIYFRHIDQPQTRDLQYLVTDGETFFHEEKRDLTTRIECLSAHSLGFRITNTAPDESYRIVKDIIGSPHQDVVLVHTRLEGDDDLLDRLRLYVLCAPHLEVGGWGNYGEVRQEVGQTLLTAHKGRTWLVLGGTAPFLNASCGYVGRSDGWTDVRKHLRMDWAFETAPDGNIALTGEIDLSQGHAFTLGVGFGSSYHSAVTAVFQSLDVPFEEQRSRFVNQWERICRDLEPLELAAGDGGGLYRVSNSLLLAHEDKHYQGATIASLSIPWGEAKGDDDIGGYHLVWTRDMYNSVTGMLAAGNIETPLRALVYLATTQEKDGGFPQNFWLDGEAYWTGVQLDGVAFPIILAWRLHEAGALRNFDPYPMVRKAAGFLIREGPVTQQERWEENSGLSPSTLASNIAALVCAAAWTRERGDESTADFLLSYADFLEQHVEAWTVTTEGTLLDDVPRHYIRINPAGVHVPYPDENPNEGTIILANRPPDSRYEFPAREIVDAGFLELVRYGIRPAGDPLIEDSLRVVDAYLKVDTPHGPCWRRYNHDGYGQTDDGGPYKEWGTGRAWPLLTGERAHYELAAGRKVMPYVRAMEGFAYAVGAMPEQVWDEEDRPDQYLFLGEPIGAAMPLAWAHAEYIKLLRSVRDGEVFDRLRVVADRYLGDEEQTRLEVWKFNRQVRRMEAGALLRIQAPAPFTLRWTDDDWKTHHDHEAAVTTVGLSFVDLETRYDRPTTICFTFHWTEPDDWEGDSFEVVITPSET